jgi:hypothetical protein
MVTEELVAGDQDGPHVQREAVKSLLGLMLKP